MKKIVMTGGGTAGHVTPNIALMPSLKEAGFEISYIGSYDGIEKGLIEECGTELHGRQYARKFRPTMTKEEYMARFLIERGVDERSLALVAMAFVRKGDLKDQEDEKLIAELENMIRKLRKRDNI